MADYRLLESADADLDGISRYSIQQWGIDRARSYVASLRRTFEHLAAFPYTGRRDPRFKEEYRRFESGEHVVFYRLQDRDVVIVRVLHRARDPARHPFE